MSFLPIFSDERAIPSQVAGLEFKGVHYFPDPGSGVSIQYDGPRPAKADAYLYDLGLKAVPSDLTSEPVAGWFREACDGVVEATRRGVYRDLEVRAPQLLHLPPEAAEPFALWASFAYALARPGTGFTGRLVSNLALRVDRGYINKVRYTYPTAAGDEGLSGFMQFLAGWTAVVQGAGARD